MKLIVYNYPLHPFHYRNILKHHLIYDGMVSNLFMPDTNCIHVGFGWGRSLPLIKYKMIKI